MYYEVRDPAQGWRRVQPELYEFMASQGRETRMRSPNQNIPWQLKNSPGQHNCNHWDVYQGSANLGSFWFGNGTIYARTTNQGGETLAEQLIGHDIGLMDTTKAAQHVYDTYHKNRERVS